MFSSAEWPVPRQLMFRVHSLKLWDDSAVHSTHMRTVRTAVTVATSWGLRDREAGGRERNGERDP